LTVMVDKDILLNISNMLLTEIQKDQYKKDLPKEIVMLKIQF